MTYAIAGLLVTGIISYLMSPIIKKASQDIQDAGGKEATKLMENSNSAQVQNGHSSHDDNHTTSKSIGLKEE